MTYHKHQFSFQRHKSTRIAKNGNRAFNLVEVDRTGMKSFSSRYGVPEEIIAEEKQALLRRLLQERKRRQEYTIATWIEAVSLKQTRLGYDDWVSRKIGRLSDIDNILEAIQ